ncbi:MAG: T9SS type A sorting domain-containing protein [Bacteroidetes bacterium]|nr:T9SS type A sorting domain-containing protein [Bacteroidota bacterium]
MKSNLNRILCFFILMVGILPLELSAQISIGGVPSSFSQAIAPDTSQVVITPSASIDALAMEDQQSPLPYRFAVNLPVNLGISTSGHWFTAANGNKGWRLNISSPGALALVLYFDKFDIPEGARVFVYNPKRTQLLGAFTSLNNNRLSTFATALIYGDALTLEYDAPEDLPLPQLHISEVGHAYRGVSDYSGLKNGFGGAGSCEVNVNCSEGASWQNEKRGVARIMVKRGGSSVWCTGSLVNNVRNDGKPYLLTADHCGNQSTPTELSQWVFYFNYEGPGCTNPTTEPPLKSVTGATMIAHGGNSGASGSDFFLVLLQSAIPASYNVYFNGWSRDTSPPSPSGTCIHQPSGDIKKISTYTAPLQQSIWINGSKLAHWKVRWVQTDHGHGTTEGGSSGSPLFDNLGRLVGTLTGGDSKCDSASLNLPDWYGMFSYSWDQNGTDSTEVLKYWLDPDNTGVMTLNGWTVSVPEPLNDSQITIFPNPVTDQLNLKYSVAGAKNCQVTIQDVFGNLRMKSDWDTGAGPEKQVDVSGFPSGMYFVRISDGNYQLVRKFVKK